ncbi:hypothetical protein PK69_13560 [Xanthomonas phaseoli pv. phaseoli]|uniref:Uncharacterized protein n=1 Tax=Xanthomonas campestris pv. phaseoli TaxID=317013 RepID=A0AB34QSB1_XANCH|nr:hypothetical protein AC609_09895 [Xanthomonas phaseoli pv. phaseoli]AZU30120.1 hypothetical protein AC801_09710 [Xanthomonas sp. ISO98C4]AZU25764.1 hypothetical protein AC611_09900 [Xanthomonas phaseoli pv. phaseoli]AZU34533.1 hypothetical protein AC610_09895 [Xanthomonas phaseoli pv. phaseoli]KGT52345.1 hypothetical protein NZ02_05375 [Xanthomonas phaseoli pv. phaseoli]
MESARSGGPHPAFRAISPQADEEKQAAPFRLRGRCPKGGWGRDLVQQHTASYVDCAPFHRKASNEALAERCATLLNCAAGKLRSHSSGATRHLLPLTGEGPRAGLRTLGSSVAAREPRAISPGRPAPVCRKRQRGAEARCSPFRHTSDAPPLLHG